MVIKEGQGEGGRCWVELDGTEYFVYAEDGKSKFGPFATLEEAAREYAKWSQR